MQLTHQPWRECVELICELDVGAFTPGEGTLNLVPKVGIRQPTSNPLHSNKTDITKLIFLHTSSMIQGDYVVHLVGMHINQVITGILL